MGRALIAIIAMNLAAAFWLALHPVPACPQIRPLVLHTYQHG